MVGLLNDRCIRVYSEMNEWMDCIFIVSAEDAERAEKVLQEAWDSYWEDGDGCFFYNCPNYITEVQFYPILKDELDLLEKEMARLKELGHEREWQKQYIKYKYLKPLVESLEVQLNGKESVG